MGAKKFHWMFLLMVSGIVCLWPLAASAGAGQVSKGPVTVTFADRQDFIDGKWLRIQVSSSKATSVSTNGNLELGTAAKKTYGETLWPIAGGEAKVARGGEATLRMHVPGSVRQKARKAVAAGTRAVIRVILYVPGGPTGQSEVAFVIKPKL